MAHYVSVQREITFNPEHWIVQVIILGHIHNRIWVFGCNFRSNGFILALSDLDQSGLAPINTMQTIQTEDYDGEQMWVKIGGQRSLAVIDMSNVASVDS